MSESPKYAVTKKLASPSLTDGESCGVELIFTVLLLAHRKCTRLLETASSKRLRQWITLALDGGVDFNESMLIDDPTALQVERVGQLWKRSASEPNSIWKTHCLGNEEITLNILHSSCLEPGNGERSWLSDEIINVCMMLVKKQNVVDVVILNCFFATKCCQPGGAATASRRWLEAQSHRRASDLLIPVNVKEYHWVVLQVVPTERSLVVYGNLKGSFAAQLDPIVEHIMLGLAHLSDAPPLASHPHEADAHQSMPPPASKCAVAPPLASHPHEADAHQYMPPPASTSATTASLDDGGGESPVKVESEALNNGGGVEGGANSSGAVGGGAEEEKNKFLQQTLDDSLSSARMGYEEIHLMRADVVANLVSRLHDPACIASLELVYKAEINVNAGSDAGSNARAYVEHISTDGTFGGEFELEVIAEILQTPLVVFELVDNTFRLTNHLNKSVNSFPAIFLLTNKGTPRAHYDLIAVDSEADDNTNTRLLLEAMFVLVKVHPTRFRIPIQAGGTVLADTVWMFGIAGSGNCMFECADLFRRAKERALSMQTSPFLEATRLLPILDAKGKEQLKTLHDLQAPSKFIFDLVWSGQSVYDETQIAACMRLYNLILQCSGGADGASMDIGHGMGNVQLVNSFLSKYASIGIENDPKIHTLAKKCVIVGNTNQAAAHRYQEAADMDSFEGICFAFMYESIKGRKFGQNNEHMATIAKLLSSNSLVAFSTTKMGARLARTYMEENEDIKAKLPGFVCISVDNVSRKGQTPRTCIFVKKAFFLGTGVQTPIEPQLDGSTVAELLHASSMRKGGFYHQVAIDKNAALKTRRLQSFVFDDKRVMLYFGPVEVHCYLTGLKVKYGESLRVSTGSGHTGILVGVGNYALRESEVSEMQPALVILKMESHETKTFRVFEQVDLMEKAKSHSRSVLTQQDLNDAKAFFKASTKSSDSDVQVYRSERIQKAASLAAIAEAKLTKANEAKANDAKAKTEQRQRQRLQVEESRVVEARRKLDQLETEQKLKQARSQKTAAQKARRDRRSSTSTSESLEDHEEHDQKPRQRGASRPATSIVDMEARSQSKAIFSDITNKMALLSNTADLQAVRLQGTFTTAAANLEVIIQARLDSNLLAHKVFRKKIQTSLDTAVSSFNAMDAFKQLKAEIALTNTRASEDSVHRLKLEATIAKKKLESYRSQIELENRQVSASRGSSPPRLESLCSSLLTVFTQERLRLAPSIPPL